MFVKSPLPQNEKSKLANIKEKRLPDLVPVLTIHDSLKDGHSSKEGAKIAAPKPIYFAEVYNRDGTRGNYPSCNAEGCGMKFRIGSLCIRSDLCKIYYKDGSHHLSPYPFRFCVKQDCLRKFPQKKKDETNYEEPSEISLQHISEEYQNYVRENLQNSSLSLI